MFITYTLQGKDGATVDNVNADVESQDSNDDGSNWQWQLLMISFVVLYWPTFEICQDKFSVENLNGLFQTSE